MASLVLVIDDHSDTRDGLATVLEMEGFSVVTAEDGYRALTLLQQGLRPCIIVMDLMMPVMNGFEFREAQLHDPTIRHIPVIACSGVTDPAETATHLAASAYVHKPTDARKIVALVRQHCLKTDRAETT
jgi:CheY-like chemotaxis protein